MQTDTLIRRAADDRSPNASIENSLSKAATCLPQITEFRGVLPKHLDRLVSLTTVRNWFREVFGYSKSTFKRTHLKEIDKDWFRGYCGVRIDRDDETGQERARPSTDRFYQSRVIWWLIERKKQMAVQRFGGGEEKPNPADYA